MSWGMHREDKEVSRAPCNPDDTLTGREALPIIACIHYVAVSNLLMTHSTSWPKSKPVQALPLADHRQEAWHIVIHIDERALSSVL